MRALGFVLLMSVLMSAMREGVLRCRSASVVSVVSGTQADIPAPIHWVRFLVYRIVVTVQFEMVVAALIVSRSLSISMVIAASILRLSIHSVYYFLGSGASDDFKDTIRACC